MGRKSGGGGGRKKSAPAPARPASRPASTSSAPPPAPRAQAPPPAQQQSSGGGMGGGLMATVAQGMAFGTGSAIAHQAVGAIAGSFRGSGDEAPAQAQQQSQSQGGGSAVNEEAPCRLQSTRFYECLEKSGNDISQCQFFFEALNACKKEDDLRKQYS
jgi:hypothetical protein